MLTAARHQLILALLRDRGSVTMAELRRRFDVTPMTLWRDLKTLDELGLLKRVRGGAQVWERVPGEPDFETKTPAALAAKRLIAACAVEEFVRAGDTVALEGGTTVGELVPYLPETRVSLVTNSLPVALRVRTVRPRLAVRVIGGWMSPISGNTTGSEAVRGVDQVTSTVCFLGATGFDGEVGPSDPNPLEIEVKRRFAARSHRVVMLVDASKFGVRLPAVTIHPRRLHAIVTDEKPPRAILRLLRRHKVRLIIAKKGGSATP